MSQIVEWYRPNPLPRLIRLGIVTGSIMICGVLVMAFGYDATPSYFIENSEAWIGVGMLFVIGGVSGTVYGVWRIHSKEEIYLQLERKGLVYVSGNQQTEIAWQAITDIGVVDKGIEINFDTNQSIRIEAHFIGIDHHSLKSRLIEVKRNALLGIRSP